MADRRNSLVPICIVLFVVFLVAFLLIGKFAATGNSYDRARGVLMDSSRDQSDAFGIILDGKYRMLEEFADHIRDNIPSKGAELDDFLQFALKQSGLASIYCARADGTVEYAVGNAPGNIPGEDYFETALAGGRGLSSTPPVAGGEQNIILAVPYTDANGEITGALCGTCGGSELRVLVSSNAYDGDAYTFIVDSSGNVILRPISQHSLVRGINMSYLRDASFETGFTYALLIESLKTGESGSFIYTSNKRTRVLAFVPFNSTLVPKNDWYVFTAAAPDAFADEVKAERKTSWLMLGMLFAFGTLAIIAMLRSESAREKAVNSEAEEIRLREERFRIVAEQSGRNVFRYDIATGTRYNDTIDKRKFDTPKVVTDMVDSIISAGIVCPDSMDDYRKFFARIRNGESPVTGDMQLIELSGQRRWYRYNSTSIFSGGKAKTAVVSYYDYTEQRERDISHVKWRMEMASLSKDKKMSLFEWNLSKDILDTERGELVVHFADMDSDTFDERTRLYSEKMVRAEDTAAYALFLNRERLIGAYHSGQFHDELEYREKTGPDDYRWMRAVVQLVPYPDSDDVKAYLTLSDIDKEKRTALALLARSERDAMTGVFNRNSFARHVTELIGGAPHSNHVFMMIDVDSFKLVNDTLGHDAGDDVLQEFTRHIRATLRPADLVGRMGGDEFMVCLPDMPYDAAISGKARQLCGALYRKLGETLTVSASIGVAIYPRDGVTFEELYKKADNALYYVKNNGKNNFAIYESGMEETSGTLTEIDSAETSSVMRDARQHSILVVYGNDVGAEVTGMLGSEYGVLSAANTRDALTLVKRYRGSLSALVLDVDSEAGLNVLKSSADTGLRSNLPVIAIARDCSADSLVRLAKFGATGVLPKPVDSKQLLLRVRMALAVAEQAPAPRPQPMPVSAPEVKSHDIAAMRASVTRVIIYDLDTHAFFADPLIGRLIAGKFDNRSLRDVLVNDGVASEADAEYALGQLARLEEGREVSVEATLPLKIPSGDMHWFRLQAVPLPGGGGLARKALIILNDINDRVQADEKLLYRAERDPLTGLYNRETFFENVRRLLTAGQPGGYVLVCVDIDDFKLINDRYGTAGGDQVLINVAQAVDKTFRAAGGVCGRVFSDNFAGVLPAERADGGMLESLNSQPISVDGLPLPLVLSVGCYRITDTSLPVSAMYDRADIAKDYVKGRYGVHIAYYEDSMLERIVSEKEIVGNADEALKGGQFEVWLQPQYNHSTGALIGAESLVRWRSPEKGLVSPGAFIPVFERNGFVYELDKYVWEQTCTLLRKWLDAGVSPLPVSVNVSRYDIFQPDFYDFITGLMAKYGLPVDLLRLEITESAFSRSTAQIIEMVSRLQKFGFMVEIDDFGSGYSSLNTLKDVPADILKLDMRFMATSDNGRRGGAITESVVRMAKWLGMPVIAEGVESREQADFLRSIGCEYVQGYLYAKPMPVAEYEKLFSQSSAEHSVRALQTIAELDNVSFWDPKSIETLVFNSYVGGACVFEYCGGRIELLRVNRKYIQIVGDGLSESDVLRMGLTDYMAPDDISRMIDSIREAIKTGNETYCEVRWLNADCSTRMYIRSSSRVIARSEERCLLYSTIYDVTAQRLAEQQERATSDKLAAVMENVSGGISALSFSDGHAKYLFANDLYYSMLGYTRDEFEAEIGNDIDAIFGLVSPEDRARVHECVARLLQSRKNDVYEFRAIHRDGSIVWLRNNAAVTCFDGVDAPVLVSVSTDVTAEKQLALGREELMDNLPCGAGTYEVTPEGVSSIYLNRALLSQLGRTERKYPGLSTREAVHPDDRPRLRNEIYSAIAENRDIVSDFRLECEDGSYLPIHFVGHVARLSDGKTFIYATYMRADDVAI